MPAPKNPGMIPSLMKSQPSEPLPATRIGAEEFYAAAVANDLPTDHGTLNKIVRLVNTGLSVRDAARQVRAAARAG